MLLAERTKEYQSKLAAYCRTGVYDSIPGVREKNVHHYRRLVFNVINDSLESAYPLTRDLLTDDEWNNAVNDFFINHNCHTPQVWYMPYEFFEYIAEFGSDLKAKYPFLTDLLLFEWLEVELFMMEDHESGFTEKGDLAIDKMILNPEHYLIHLEYPVHLKNASSISEDDRGDYFLIIHREPETCKVIFTDLSPALVRMIELLEESPMSINVILDNFVDEAGIELNEQIYQLTKEFFERALKSRLILGFE